jgi:alpha-galactosidase/6-phospho-beta-glucosidase family protein
MVTFSRSVLHHSGLPPVIGHNYPQMKRCAVTARVDVQDAGEPHAQDHVHRRRQHCLHPRAAHRPVQLPELRQATIALHDIDPERLETSAIVARHVAAKWEAQPTISTTLDRGEALDGADYVICMIQVAGYEPGTVTDFEVPKKYGLRQTIADTLGIGGIMRGLRTIPVLLDICRDMERLCPGALFLNYVNPMAINCWAIARASTIRTVGLCHSVPLTAAQLASNMGLDPDEVNYLAAGINHMAFFLRLERNGEDLYPRLHQVIAEGRVPDHNRVRYDMLRRLGYFVTESSEHFSEYVPWFIKRDRPDLIESATTSRSTSTSAAARRRSSSGTSCATSWWPATRCPLSASASVEFAPRSSTAWRRARRAPSMATCPTTG